MSRINKSRWLMNVVRRQKYFETVSKYCLHSYLLNTVGWKTENRKYIARKYRNIAGSTVIFPTVFLNKPALIVSNVSAICRAVAVDSSPHRIIIQYRTGLTWLNETQHHHVQKTRIHSNTVRQPGPGAPGVTDPDSQTVPTCHRRNCLRGFYRSAKEPGKPAPP